MRIPVGLAARSVRLPLLLVVPLVTWLAILSPLGGPSASAAPLVPHAYPSGGMIGFGNVNVAAPAIPQPVDSPILTGAATPDGQGYWLVSADGGVFTAGDASFEGSLGSLPLQGPIMAMAATPDGKGYWLGALDGGIFAMGDAGFYGSMGGTKLNQPIVGMASTPDGKGYWLVAADGGIFSFGDAHFYGSTGAIKLNQPIVGMASTADGGGYWMVAADGGIFAFGDAQFYGSLGSVDLPDSVVGMFASPDGQGYTMTTENGVPFAFGDAQTFGKLELNPTATPISAIIGNNAGTGYWLLDPDAWNYSFTSPTPEGSFPGSAAIVAAAASQVQPDPDHGNYCNPYGPCEEWCALFATWAWRQGGVAVPAYAFTGDMYTWTASHGILLPPTATPDPGDAVLYGTGPRTTSTSVHVGVVTQVWPDGAIVTVDGDSGPGRDGDLSVVINGPFLPVDSASYNGVGIYAIAQP